MRARVLTFVSALVLATLATADVAFAQQQPAEPTPPEGFALNAMDQAYLDQVLEKWRAESEKVQTFTSEFTRLVYDQGFAAVDPSSPTKRLHLREELGRVSYQQPDKGSFQITEVRVWDAAQSRHVTNPNAVGEHWVCDGEAVYEYKHEQSQLVVRPLPPELRGKSIIDGPLPFLFGAEPEKLKARYWMRVDPNPLPGQVRLAASPKSRADAANYTLVELMLDDQRLLPTAMRVWAPDGSQTVYTFRLDQAEVNSRMTQLWNTLFQSPRTPFGWTRVVEQPPQSQAAQPSDPPR
jgi:TIGR03009 family protein